MAHFSNVCFINLSKCVAGSAKRLLLKDGPVKNNTGHIKQTEWSTAAYAHAKALAKVTLALN